ncbi:acyltransferase family protein [Vibrio sp. B1FLJ16]|uniref:acyltransferase family protein n=1 Tax=Vibrio sp. B1FLJ16 TaxID=2751178 RepID=UPI0015F5AEFF|nr:acyltransferase family protein [Vibrio sp. B1FLJ16]
MKSERIAHIDVAKGISILLVVLLHTEIKELWIEIFDYMGLVRLPLFFILSGVFYKYNKFTYVLSRKSSSLLKPYFFTLLSVSFIAIVLNGDKELWQLKGVLYGTGVLLPRMWYQNWYLPHLWLVFISATILLKVIHIDKNEKIKGIIISIMLMFFGYNLFNSLWNVDLQIFNKSITIPGLPFNADVIFSSLGLFLLGFILKDAIKNHIPNTALTLVFLIVFVFCVSMGAKASIYSREVQLPLLVVFGSLSGVYLIITMSFYIAKYTNYIKKSFIYLGQSSLIILIFHVFYYMISKSILDSLFPNSNNESIIIASVTCIYLSLLTKKLVDNNDLLSFFYYVNDSKSSRENKI